MKQQIGKYGIIPVMPVCILATEADGRLNFAPHGQIGTVTADPAVVYISVLKEHLTAQNIMKTQRFSVGIPTAAMLDKVLQGSVSGTSTDKSSLFSVFRGESGVPMILDCPVCFVCKVVQTIELHDFYMFLGEVLETWADGNCLKDNLPDVEKVLPLLCSVDGSFRSVGESIRNSKE